MSGGVDSLRTATLLKEQGHDVFGIHMRLLPDYQNERLHAEARSQAREDALDSLASRFGIPLTVIDLRDVFENKVILPFLRAYQGGLTPNPCVLCNPTIKFGFLLDEALNSGADRLATGHYVRLLPPSSSSGRFRLYRGSDPAKDQSYFLCGLTQHQLSFSIFPLGLFSKTDVLRWAEQAGVAGCIPSESQEICFIPSGSYQELLKERLHISSSHAAGSILDMEGNVLGRHKGVFAYTIGQRRGLGIASTAPYYVVDLDPANNIVRVGRATDLHCSKFDVENVNWISITPPTDAIRCMVRIRNQHIPAPALLSPVDEGTRFRVRFDEPQKAVTPGQAAVLYDGDLVLGGGIIAKK